MEDLIRLLISKLAAVPGLTIEKLTILGLLAALMYALHILNKAV